MSARRPGPHPEVLSRLAQGVQGDDPRRPPSAPARMVGIALCAVTAATVLGAIIMVGSP